MSQQGAVLPSPPPQSAACIAAGCFQTGVLFLEDLDEFLGEDQFEQNADELIQALGDLPVVFQQRELRSLAQYESRDAWIPPGVDDESLRRYIRRVRARRTESGEERRMARALEFAIRREQEETACAGDRRCRQRRREEVDQVRALFVEANLGLAVDAALAYRTYGIPVMDLIQEANTILIRAVEKYDWRKQVRFQTYAAYWFRQAIERWIANNKGIVRVPCVLQQKFRRLRREGVLPRRKRDATVSDIARAFEVSRGVATHLLETERAVFSLDTVSKSDDNETFASQLEDTTEPEDLVGGESTLLQTRIQEALDDLESKEREVLLLRFGLRGSSPLSLEKVGRHLQVSRERVRQLQVKALKKLKERPAARKLAEFI